MRKVVLVVVLTATACGSPGAAPAGGIQGVVTAGPTCPVERQGSPCPPGVWTGTVRATEGDGSVHDTLTDSGGHYALRLDPGTYSVVPLVATPGPPLAKPVDVTVGDSMQTVDLQVDTGIR